MLLKSCCVVACAVALIAFPMSLAAAEPLPGSGSRSIYESATLALAQHPQVRRQAAQVSMVEAEQERVEAGYLPKVSLNLGVGREDSNTLATRSRPGGSSVELERREAGVRVQQMLFDGFRTHWQTRSAEERVDAMQWERRFALGELALQAMVAHLDLLRVMQEREFHRLHVEAHGKILTDIEARIRSGKDEAARRGHTQARLARAEAAAHAAQQELARVGEVYRQLTGTTGVNELREASLSDWPLPISSVDLIDAVRANNALLQSRLALQKSARSSAQAEDTLASPYVFVETGANWDANIDGTRGRNSDAFVMLRLNYDLYSGGSDQARSFKAREQAELTRYERELLQQELERDALVAWEAHQGQEQQRQSLLKARQFTEETHQRYYRQFSIGQRSLTELLDMENELLDARLQWLRVETDLAISGLQIQWYAGNLLAHLAEVGAVEVLQ